MSLFSVCAALMQKTQYCDLKNISNDINGTFENSYTCMRYMHIYLYRLFWADKYYGRWSVCD